MIDRPDSLIWARSRHPHLPTVKYAASRFHLRCSTHAVTADLDIGHAETTQIFREGTHSLFLHGIFE